MQNKLDRWGNPYVTACGKPFESRRAGIVHEKHCWQCQLNISDIKGNQNEDAEDFVEEENET